MSEIGDYRRLVEKPAIARYEATIASLRSENERLQDALRQLVDYVKDGCPDDGRYCVMTEAQAALKGIIVCTGSHGAILALADRCDKWLDLEGRESPFTLIKEASVTLKQIARNEQNAK